MPLRQQDFTAAARAALTCATLVWVQASASPAETAGPRPFFQMPVACGQTWEASTYDGHWPDQDSIDLGQWSAAEANVSKGEPVLASADGTVLNVFTSPGGDSRGTSITGVAG